MRAFRVIAIFIACALGWTLISRGQQGPLGTGSSSETVAKPKTSPTTGAADPGAANTDAPKIPSKFEKKDKEITASTPVFRTDASTVSVDVAVLDNKGQFIPKIPKSNFRILEDNVPQALTSFSTAEAPITIAMVVEFSNRYQSYYSQTWFQTLTAAYGFVQTLKPEDYVAIVAYDMRSEILSDFSNDRQQTYEAMQMLRIPGFSESNLYDALVDTAQRMQNIEGRKAILLISSGVDTFSKLTYDKARRAIQDAGVPIYAIGLMQSIRIMAEARGMGNLQEMEFLQADLQMKTFAKESGGMSFFPRFYGEFPGIFKTISDALRSQYTLTYVSSNQARDGKFRKIKVELVNPDNNQPLRMTDEKGKPFKYEIVAKTGYTAPREVE